MPADIMTRAEAEQCRAKMMDNHRQMAARAANKGLRWGDRYEAAIIADDCLDIAKDFNAYIQLLDQES